MGKRSRKHYLYLFIVLLIFINLIFNGYSNNKILERDNHNNKKNNNDNNKINNKFNIMNISKQQHSTNGGKKKSLISLPVGKKSKNNVDKLINQVFGLKKFDFILFHFDNSEWNEFDWYKKVTSIRVLGQMKWWYIKRFITKELADDYKYIFLIDDDSELISTNFEVEEYINILDKYHVHISQPSQNPFNSYHPVVAKQCNSIGRWTDFVECGPMIVFSSYSWKTCGWECVANEMSSGWGLDSYLHYCCGLGRSAIIDVQSQNHASTKGASSKPHWYPKVFGESKAYEKMMKQKHVKESTKSTIRVFNESLDTFNDNPIELLDYGKTLKNRKSKKQINYRKKHDIKREEKIVC